MASSVIIGYLPDTLITSFVDRDTFQTLGYLVDLQARIPGISFDNPIAQATVGESIGTLVIKPLHQATESDWENILASAQAGRMDDVLNRMRVITNLGA